MRVATRVQLFTALVMLSVMTALHDDALSPLGVLPDEARARIKAWALFNLRMHAYLVSARALAIELARTLERHPVPIPMKGWVYGDRVQRRVDRVDVALADVAIAVGELQGTALGLEDGFILERRANFRPANTPVHAYTFTIAYLWRAAGWGEPQPHQIEPSKERIGQLVAEGVLTPVRDQRGRWRDSLRHCRENVELDLTRLPPIAMRAESPTVFDPEAIWLLAEAQNLRQARPKDAAQRDRVSPDELLGHIVSRATGTPLG